MVLPHGLTDAPYSLRHVAARYRERGWIAIGIRMPAHGTVPAALTDAEWEDWMAAARLSVREAHAWAGADGLLHLVGFLSGGALDGQKPAGLGRFPAEFPEGSVASPSICSRRYRSKVRVLRVSLLRSGMGEWQAAGDVP